MSDRQLQRRNTAALAQLALDHHLRRCRTCSKSLQRRQRLCSRGRELLYALQAASELVSRT